MIWFPHALSSPCFFKFIINFREREKEGEREKTGEREKHRFVVPPATLAYRDCAPTN